MASSFTTKYACSSEKVLLCPVARMPKMSILLWISFGVRYVIMCSGLCNRKFNILLLKK